MKKKKMGRPPLPKGESKDAQIAVRFKPLEYDYLNQYATTTGTSAVSVLRTAAISEIQTPPIWVHSKWKWEELNEKTVQFVLGTPGGMLRGIGTLKAKPDGFDRISVDIFLSGPASETLVPVVRIWLSEDAVNDITKHPEQSVANFRLEG